MKNNYKTVGDRSRLFIQQEEYDEQIISCAKPGEQVRHPCFIHIPSDNWQMRFCRQPYSHWLCFEEPVCIEFCQPCEYIHHRHLKTDNADTPRRNKWLPFLRP